MVIDMRAMGGLLLAGFLAAASGCSSAPPASDIQPAQVGKQKLEAMKQLADAVAKNPDSTDAMAAFEEFRNLPLDPTLNRQELTEIIQIYRTRVKGKIRGAIVEELTLIMASLEAAAKGGK